MLTIFQSRIVGYSGVRRKFPGGGGGGAKFRHNRVMSQTSFAFAKTAWFYFTFLFLGSEGGHGTVASPFGTLVVGYIEQAI